jgi:small subunit ribosomal protein S8
MMTDTIADLLTRIRNGHRARHQSVRAPWSRMSHSICTLLTEQGYLKAFEKAEVAGHPGLLITLAYDAARKPAILGIRRVSKPGCRLFVDKEHLPRVRNGLGVALLTTSRGVMTDAEARRQGVGGEILCEVW